MNYTFPLLVRRNYRCKLLAAAVALAVPAAAYAQMTPADHAAHQAAGAHPPTTTPAGRSAADSIPDLQAKVAKLEAALKAKSGGMAAAADKPMAAGKMPKGDKPMADDKMPMGGKPMGGGMAAKPMAPDKPMMDDDDKEMAAMGAPPAGGKMAGGMGMPMMDKMMGMSPAAATNAMAVPTALPGFPGASHLYHIGSTGFFLDHDQHITLSVEQQTSLNAAKEKALLDKATGQRAIDAAEQELWALTASDRPDATTIEAKVREVETLRGDQRLAFIRAVGTAATILTDPQRQALLGMTPPQAPPAPAAAMPGMPAAPAAPPMPPAGGGMGGDM